MPSTTPLDTTFQQHEIIEQRTITEVRRAEDGWFIEFEDQRGIRLAYWVADSGYVPQVGDPARFYGGALGQPLHGLEINGCRVFLNSAD